jgi:anaerobic dimethyl sulfoxide reductase subunit C (anchor subunit)
VVFSQGTNYFADYLYARSILIISLTSLIFGTLIASLHLSRPSRSSFALSNIRNSWLSREASLGGFFGFLIFVLLIKLWFSNDFGAVDYILILFGTFTGLYLVYIISRLYMLRTIPVWNNLGTPITFFITSILLGLLVNTSVWLLYVNQFEIFPAFLSIFILVALQLFVNIITISALLARGGKAAESVRLIWSDCRYVLMMRWITALFGLGILVSKRLLLNINPAWVYISFVLVFVSEILGRVLFYAQYRREGY